MSTSEDAYAITLLPVIFIQISSPSKIDPEADERLLQESDEYEPLNLREKLNFNIAQVNECVATIQPDDGYDDEDWLYIKKLAKDYELEIKSTKGMYV